VPVVIRVAIAGSKTRTAIEKDLTECSSSRNEYGGSTLPDRNEPEAGPGSHDSLFYISSVAASHDRLSIGGGCAACQAFSVLGSHAEIVGLSDLQRQSGSCYGSPPLPSREYPQETSLPHRVRR
jgi:hypothetical protein